MILNHYIERLYDIMTSGRRWMRMENLICKICGMMISEKSLSYNQEALTAYNTPEDVRYCPFCGAHKKHFTLDKEDVYKIEEGELTQDEMRSLDHASKLEVFNGDFYAEASERSVREENKKMFKALSNIEYVHARVHLRLLGRKEMPKINKMTYERLKNDEDFMNEANTREKHAVKFYNKSIEGSENEIVKKVMECFAEIESDHIEMTLF